jgi:hypothetical protein
VDIQVEENARKLRVERDAAWEKLASARRILTARGKSVKEWDPRRDDKEAILKSAIGPSGNLRAPTLQVGDVILIGFNQDMYQAYLGAEDG